MALGRPDSDTQPGCLEWEVAPMVDDRCTVADVVAELDALAGRGRARRRSRWRR